MSRQFICDPAQFCDKGTCCKSPDTTPALSTGDFLRLSELTGEPIEQIWRTKGTASISRFDGMDQGVFILGTGLLHSPCPYLKEARCSVHTMRPLSCAGFPSMLIKEKNPQLFTIYQDYKCLQNVRLHPAQERAVKEIDSIMQTEADLDIKYIWEKPRYVNLSTKNQYLLIAQQAFLLQLQRDPIMSTPRSKSLVESIDNMCNLIERATQGLEYDRTAYKVLCSTTLYSLLEDEIANRFATLTYQARSEYARTTQRWKELRNRM